MRSDSFVKFFELVNDPEVFQFKGINLTKFYYDKFVARFTDYKQAMKKPLSKSRLLGLFVRLREVIQTFYMIGTFGLLNRKPRTLFYGGVRAISINHKLYDVYNPKILDSLGKKNFIIMEDYFNNPKKQYSANGYETGLNIIRLGIIAILIVFQGNQFQNFAGSIFAHYPALGWTTRQLYKSALYFYSSYILNRWLIRIMRIKNIVMICHYSHLPWIAAARSLHLPVVELMHGLIVPQHPHYVISNFPQNFEKAFREHLLPGSLGVFGDYWKEIVDSGKQFDSDDVFVLGYFHQVPPLERKTDRLDGRKVILVTSQPTVQKEIRDYLLFLSNNLDKKLFRVVLKPHPAENGNFYASVLSDGAIEISYRNIHDLFSECDMHISVYSTTLYEATRYGICNYTLLVDKFLDVNNEIIQSGAALPLHQHEIPSLYPVSSNDNNIFTEFDPESLISHLEQKNHP